MVTGPFVRVHFSEKARFSIQSSRTAILGLSSSGSGSNFTPSNSACFSNCSLYNKSNFHYTLRCGYGSSPDCRLECPRNNVASGVEARASRKCDEAVSSKQSTLASRDSKRDGKRHGVEAAYKACSKARGKASRARGGEKDEKRRRQKETMPRELRKRLLKKGRMG